MYLQHFICYLEFMILTLSARGYLNFLKGINKVSMHGSKWGNKSVCTVSIHPSIHNQSWSQILKVQLLSPQGGLQGIFPAVSFSGVRNTICLEEMSSYVARSSLVLLCKYTEQPDNYSPPLEGTETFQDIDHLCCPASSKSISCAHAGSGWMRHGDSAQRPLLFNESKSRFGAYAESVKEGRRLSGASHY